MARSQYIYAAYKRGSFDGDSYYAFFTVKKEAIAFATKSGWDRVVRFRDAVEHEVMGTRDVVWEKGK